MKYVNDVKTVRRMGGAISDHSVALCKVRLGWWGSWTKKKGGSEWGWTN